MQTLTELPNITLYYREGTSDKVYQCQIEAAGERFVVNFAYGRRGSTLNTGTKTNVPVEYADAKRIFDRLVKEKKSKGYTEGESGTPYLHSEQQVSGLIPQLLNSIDEAQVLNLMNDDNWGMQEKFNGRRLIVRKQGQDITGINKRATPSACPCPCLRWCGIWRLTWPLTARASGTFCMPSICSNWMAWTFVPGLTANVWLR